MTHTFGDAAEFRELKIARATALIAMVWPLTLTACVGVAAEDGDYAGSHPCLIEKCEIVLTPIATISEAAVPGDLFMDRPNRVLPLAEKYLVLNGFDGLVVFDMMGEFLMKIGGQGEGPGEFRMPFPPAVGPGDSVHVYDGIQRRLTVVDPDLRFARAQEFRYWPRLVLEDGSYIVPEQIRTPDRIGFPLHRIAPDGEILLSFGTDAPQYRPDMPNLTQLSVGPAADGKAVWAAPLGQYVLSKWNPFTGEELTRVEVTSSWFRESVRPSPPEERPVPTIQTLWEAPDGLIWVLLHDADENWTPELFQERRHQVIDFEYLALISDYVLEVVDPNDGSVIASRRFLDPIWAQPQARVLTAPRDPFALTTDLEVWRPQLQHPED